MKFKLLLPLVALAALIGATVLEAKTFPLTSSQATPAASGKVDVRKDSNGNTQLAIKADNLAQPGMLTPPATSYVVWFQDQSGAPTNQGQLKVDKNLKGEFKTTTRLQNFDLFVSAENDPLTKHPTGDTVLKAKIQNVD